eukprot:g2870.t1
MVRKSLFIEQDSNEGVSVQQLRPFEDWLCNNELTEKLGEKVKTELKLIWQRAERVDELQTIVRSFHRYKVELSHGRKIKDSLTTSNEHSENHWKQISTKLDEILQNQYRLEKKLAVLRTPDETNSEKNKNSTGEVMSGSSGPPEVSVASVIKENEQQMNRVEDMLLKINIPNESINHGQLRSDSLYPLVAFEEEKEDFDDKEDSLPKSECEFPAVETENFFLESEQDNRRIFTIRPQFVMERSHSIDESPTEKELSVSLKRLDDLASIRNSFQKQDPDKTMDLFKDEFCQDICKVQENISASGIEMNQIIFKKNQTEEKLESAFVPNARSSCSNDATVFLISSKT